MAASFAYVQYKGKTVHMVRASGTPDVGSLYSFYTLCTMRIDCDTTPGSGAEWQEVTNPEGARICGNCKRVRLAWYRS